MRWAASRALGKLKGSQAIKPIIRALHDEDPGVRRIAAEALGMIGDSTATNPLIKAIGDENWSVRWAAYKAPIAYADILARRSSPLLLAERFR